MLISSVDSVSLLAEVDFMNSIYTQRLVDINSEYTVAQLNYGNKAFSLYVYSRPRVLLLPWTQRNG